MKICEALLKESKLHAPCRGRLGIAKSCACRYSTAIPLQFRIKLSSTCKSKYL